jgi:endoglucanase Acf2
MVANNKFFNVLTIKRKFVKYWIFPFILQKLKSPKHDFFDVRP